MSHQDCDLESLREFVTRFRVAIEATDFGDLDFNLSRFPRDCCHHAAALLRLYLFDQGLGFFDKAQGRRPDGRQHVWLSSSNVVIDITADQFEEGQIPVIVTRGSSWHAAWKLGPANPTDLGMIEENREFYAARYPIYPRILANIAPSRH